MENLRVLLCVLFCLSQSYSIDPNKAVVCLGLSKLRLQEPSKAFLQSLEVPGIQYEQVYGKVLSSMTLHCYDYITIEDVAEALEYGLEGDISQKLKTLTPMTEDPICALEDVEMSLEERRRFVELVQAVKDKSKRTESRGGEKM